MTAANKTDIVKDLALRLGFDRVGIAPLGPSPRAGYYRGWLAAGHAGTMAYLGRNVPLRENPAQLLEGARFVICVGLNHKRSDTPEPAGKPATGQVSQYARGVDYHRVMRTMLDELVAELRSRLDEPFEARVFVDTGPILERELAAAAGLGWIGKNTILLHERLGSYLFLGEVLTTLDLAPDSPVTDHCGSCTRCIDACPTSAFPAPYQLDASRCISYLTIEHRGEAPSEFAEQTGNWVFGCDICQQVCPFNNHAPNSTHPELSADLVPAHVTLLDLLNLRSGEYRRLTRNSATSRARRNMLRRNAAVALGNAPALSDAERTSLRDAAKEADSGVRAAAVTAMKKNVRPRA